ncbi:lamin tail domain-containing protein [Persicimonas caeni]|uniref:Lamin tail domain-containing protein n=1 Tax=Persicimonas caeni TaxID=2292766 RepID=A0A4Y6PN31_PERCE|nr:lamin tail domain-containing protein [Persicimonas caeni]QDG49718.1 lamin tail domain-containing protein [Persicimonas caeni]QED30939.1 lamin tail domain-containing protein [Persicimonas caeni]
MKCSTRSLLLIAASVFALGLSACSADDPSTGKDDSCVVNSDCADDEICGSDGNCVVVSDEACSADSDCTDIPEPQCNGDDLVTYGGVCDGDDAQTCTYPEVNTETCEAGCTDGACNPDPCENVTCDEPPAAQCSGNGELVEYEATGTCGAGECSYDRVSPAQQCVHGCQDGACLTGPCDAEACDTPPAPECDGNTGIVYADTGTCNEEDGSATCSYDITYNNCDYVGGTCDESTGTCTDTVTETGGAMIVEIMANAAGSYESGDEWFEVVNDSGSAIDLSGWTIRSGTSTGTVEEHALTSAPAFAADARLVFASSADPADDGTVTPDYVYAGITLNNNSDYIELLDSNGAIVDRVFWEAGTTLDGKSRKLDPNATDNDDFADWCPELDSTYGDDGEFGTPGAANPPCAADACADVTCQKPDDFCNADGNAVQYTLDTADCQVSRFNNPYCDFMPQEVDCTDAEYCLTGVCEAVTGTLPSPGDIIFTEFMGNPSAISDSDGEYLELYNTTDQELTLFTLVIKDNETGNSQDSFVVENPTATIPANGYVVFAADTDSSLNGGIQNAYLLDDSPLKNSPGSAGLVISLELQDGTVIDEAYYGEPTAGASQQLSIDAYTGGATNVAQSNDSDANFCDATSADSAYTSGDFGSPGVANVSCAPIQ